MAKAPTVTDTATNGAAPARKRAPQRTGPKTLYVILKDEKLAELGVTRESILSCIESTTMNGRILVDMLTSDTPKQVIKFVITAGPRRNTAGAPVPGTDGEHEEVTVA